MGRKASRKPVPTDEGRGSVASTSAVAPIPATPDTALIDIAEELGRLLARRLLADPGRRRGYSLVEILLGATVMVVMWVLIARLLGWLPH